MVVWLLLILFLKLNVISATAWFKSMFLTPESFCGLIPPGHKLPFGYHKQPLPDMETIPNDIDIATFHHRYVKPEGFRPGVFRGMQSDSIAVKQWTDDYLNKTFGFYKVLTEVKREQRLKYGKRLNKLSKFLGEYNTTNQYVVTILPDDMRHEVHMPPFLQCGTYSKNLLELNFWMSSGGTASQVHYDADHNVHCLLAGAKSFFMMHPREYHKLRMDRIEFTGSNFCPTINQNSVDMELDPLTSDVDYQWTMLYPGDCIFIPSKYMHQVRSYGRSISVTILWDPERNYNKADDDKTCKPQPGKRISDFNVVWHHKPDDLFFDVGYATPHVLRKELIGMWDDWEELHEKEGIKQVKGFTYHEFVELMFSVIKWDLARCQHTEVWAALVAYGLDTDRNHAITLDELKNSSDDAMKAISHLTDAPNLDEQRYYDFCRDKFFYLPPEVIGEKEKAAINATGSVVDWIEQNGFKRPSLLSKLFVAFRKFLFDDNQPDKD